MPRYITIKISDLLADPEKYLIALERLFDDHNLKGGHHF